MCFEMHLEDHSIQIITRHLAQKVVYGFVVLVNTVYLLMLTYFSIISHWILFLKIQSMETKLCRTGTSLPSLSNLVC